MQNHGHEDCCSSRWCVLHPSNNLIYQNSFYSMLLFWTLILVFSDTCELGKDCRERQRSGDPEWRRNWSSILDLFTQVKAWVCRHKQCGRSQRQRSRKIKTEICKFTSSSCCQYPHCALHYGLVYDPNPTIYLLHHVIGIHNKYFSLFYWKLVPSFSIRTGLSWVWVFVIYICKS